MMTDQPKIRVLLVDDEETLLEYLTKRLFKLGFHVKATFSGEQAVQVAKEEHHDVVHHDDFVAAILERPTRRKWKFRIPCSASNWIKSTSQDWMPTG